MCGNEVELAYISLSGASLPKLFLHAVESGGKREVIKTMEDERRETQIQMRGKERDTDTDERQGERHRYR